MVIDRSKRFIGKERPSVSDTKTTSFPIKTIALGKSLEDIKRYLNEELNQLPVYRTVWTKATEKFNQDVASRSYPKTAADEYYIAIIAYSYESSSGVQIYADFNKSCRNNLSDANSWNSFPYKSLYCLLAQAPTKVQSNPSITSGRIYRGLDFYFNCRESQVIDFKQFSSCSFKRDEAESFASTSGTLFEIELALPAGQAIGIAKYSCFPQEEEVLLVPWAEFKVKSVTTKDTRRDVVLKTV